MKTWLKQNLSEIIAIAPVCLIVLFAYGCEPKARSILHPGRMVTRGELTAEMENYLALTELRFENLDKQEKFRQLLFEQAVLLGTGGQINPIGLLTTLMSIIGGAAIVDNRRMAHKLKSPA